ncbi:MAG: hypothetical protein RMK92_09810, partial [Armatimonadota bacterium]|nr:hypothetical protein [Armatimonadota bacterium]
MVVEDLRDLIRLLEQHPDWRAELRKVLLGDELLQLPELVREILLILRQHSEILQRHSEAIERLIEAQRRTEERLEQYRAEMHEEFRRVWEAIQQLAEAQRRTDQRMEELIQAQQ